MIKPEVLGDKEIIKHNLPDGMYDITGLCLRQRDDTHKKDCQMFLEWGDKDCPHKLVRLNDDSLVPVKKAECDKCWQEFKSYVEGLK